MKKRIPPFLFGMLTMALIGGLGVTALAATGQMTITVDPINIQVNGQTFQPKDEKGNDVPVFAYNGTTYAPLRALAEAYGLTVDYDQEANMATVGKPFPIPENTATPADYSDWREEDEAAYQEFKGLWEVEGPTLETDEAGNWAGYIAYCNLDNDREENTISLYHSEHPDYIQRFVLEYRDDEDITIMNFYGVDKDGNIKGPVLPIWTIQD